MPSVEAGAPGPLTAMSPIRLQFAQKAFIVAGGRLLLVRKAASDPFHPGRWEVPGGRLEVEDDLDLDDHIRREVWEEVGLKIEPGPPFHLWQWFMPDRAAPARGARIRVVAAARRCRPSPWTPSWRTRTPATISTAAPGCRWSGPAPTTSSRACVR